MSNSNGNKARATALGVSYETALEVGARLKVARERLGRDPISVAARIKIREHYITAIEQGQWNELPPGLNGRGLVRIYAREMGVDIPELEPQQSVTATHPQYEPTGQVSVISRQALLERGRSRPAQDIGRSVSRNNGGNLHSQGVRPLSRAPLSAPPGVGLGFPGQGNNVRSLDSRAQEIIQRNAAATSQRLQPASSRVGSGTQERRGESDDEAPLDVFTPDVASILGLTEQDLSPREEKRPLNPPTLAPEGIPVVSVDNMASEMFGGGSVQESARFEEPPETLPISQLFREPPATRPAVEESLPPQPASKDILPLSDSPVSLEERESLQDANNAPPDHTSAVSAVAPAQVSLHGHLPRSGVAVESAKGASQGPTTARGLSGKSLLGYTGAALVAVGLGAFFFAPRDAEEFIPENGALVSAPAAENEGAVSDANVGLAEGAANSNASPSGAMNDGGVLTSSSDLSVTGVDGGSNGSASDAARLPAGAQPANEAAKEGAANSGVGVQSLSAESGAPAVAPVVTPVAQDEETSILGTGSVTQAKLTLTDSVEVQITADGKRVFSGTKPPGVITIDFAKTAEIFVSDGSKATLAYGTWDHGALGHPGRKRRIFLNAQAYTPPAQ